LQDVSISTLIVSLLGVAWSLHIAKLWESESIAETCDSFTDFTYTLS